MSVIREALYITAYVSIVAEDLKIALEILCMVWQSHAVV